MNLISLFGLSECNNKINCIQRIGQRKKRTKSTTIWKFKYTGKEYTAKQTPRAYIFFRVRRF